MKKVEEKYYCDLCGKECEHTPDYVYRNCLLGLFKVQQLILSKKIYVLNVKKKLLISCDY